MNREKCQNCDYEFDLVQTTKINEGFYVECPECKCMIKTTQEVELSDEHLARCDEIYDAIYTMCKVLTGKDDLEYDMAYLGPIAELATNLLTSHGECICFPAVVTDLDGSQFIEEIYYPED